MKKKSIKYYQIFAIMLVVVSFSLMSFESIKEGDNNAVHVIASKGQQSFSGEPLVLKKATNKETVVAWYKNVDAGNYVELRKLMGSNYSFKNSMSPEAADGNTHIAMLTMFSAAFSDMKHTFTRFVNEGEWIAVYGRVTGKHTGEFSGIAPTNQEMSNTWMHLFHIVDGKVADAYFEMNPAIIINQISVK